jgi:uncharacterized protein with von Willebrand factor type A (vWA) domain
MTHDAFLRSLVSLGRALRAGGAEVGTGRTIEAARALDAVGLGDRRDVYFALRQTLIGHYDELELFDRIYDAWLEGNPTASIPERRSDASVKTRRKEQPGDGGGQTDAADTRALGASAVEVLRRRDFASLNDDELSELRRLLVEVGRVRPQRTSRRLRSRRRGERLDLRGVVRRSMRSGGELFELPMRTRKIVPRKLVVLCDVSGSMAPYARALLLFLHATAQTRHVETFAFGTRLARLTADLATRDPDVALARVTSRVVDWGSGTRIGASLAQFNNEYGHRALSRGAVVVIASDGWERDDPASISHEMARLARSAYAIVWVNPLKGTPGYEPLASGMRAALPFVDRFLAGHNLESLEGLAGVLAGIERRHAA